MPDTLLPGKPEESVEEFPDSIKPNELFQVSLRKGNEISQRVFHFPQERDQKPKEHLEKAISSAKIYCERMRYKFLWCRRWLTNFAEDIKRMEETD